MWWDFPGDKGRLKQVNTRNKGHILNDQYYGFTEITAGRKHSWQCLNYTIKSYSFTSKLTVPKRYTKHREMWLTKKCIFHKWIEQSNSNSGHTKNTENWQRFTQKIYFSITVLGLRMKGLTSLMRTEAFLAAAKNGVSEVYLKLPLFFSKEALYSLC